MEGFIMAVMLTDVRYWKILRMAAKTRGLDRIPMTKYEMPVASPVVILREDSLPDLSPEVKEWLDENSEHPAKLRYDLKTSRLKLAFNDEQDMIMFKLRFA
jgi:hypothetical protein